MKYILPTVNSQAFTCPNCGVLSKQDWWSRAWDNSIYQNEGSNAIRVGQCHSCYKNTLWVNDKMFYPDNGNAPHHNPDMPDSVKKLYLEASSIFQKSPRGACALLRLGIQVLCKELEEPGENINKDIASLVKKGLPVIVQQSLDIVRVTGNDAVHPGQIDTDDVNIVNKLFELTNIIVEYMIALPKKVSSIYDALPEDKKKGIADRDK